MCELASHLLSVATSLPFPLVEFSPFPCQPFLLVAYLARYPSSKQYIPYFRTPPFTSNDLKSDSFVIRHKVELYHLF